MLLKPNLDWPQNRNISLPTVLAEISIEQTFLYVSFMVEEPLDCFRSEVKEDNGRSWEDSCVEIFLQNPTNPKEYFNFETTCRGFLLAAHGESRENRAVLLQSEINSIKRIKQTASIAGNLVCWGMEIEIPSRIFGLDSFEGKILRGNLYKCADLAKTPHYLSAFPINTEKPDFHRPEFFQELTHL